MLNKPKIHIVPKNEEGFASIVIALVLIIVLALLTVGFAQLARREQQDALDKQLNSQAYYAAESGVNDAYRALKDPTLVSSLTNGPTTCYGAHSPIPGTSGNIVDSASGTQYTCVLVDMNPKSLEKDLPTDSQWTTAFTVATTPSYMKLTWNPKRSKAPSTDTQHKFRPQQSSDVANPAWNAPAVIQFSITPLNNLDRNSLIANTYTVYMYPSTDSPGSNPAYSTAAANQGKVVPGNCDASGKCSVTISGGFPAGVTSYLIHALGYYDDSHLSFTAVSGVTQLRISGSQAVIDSTGQDKNVLKRIQVHVPIFPSSDVPDYPLQALNICKRFTTYPTGPGQSQNTVMTPSGIPVGFDTSSCNFN